MLPRQLGRLDAEQVRPDVEHGPEADQDRLGLDAADARSRPSTSA